MEELLAFRKDARITILKNGFYKNGLDKPPVLVYQMILSWDIGKYKTEDGTPYNSFVETWGATIDECVEQLKKDIKNMNVQ